MLAKTEQKLQTYYAFEPLKGADGQLHEVDRITKINDRQCDFLAKWHKSVKPDLSIETGLAYGFSTISFLDSMEELDYGHHIAIDPSQMSYWHGVALVAIEDLGFSSRFTWLNDRSDSAFAKMIAEKKRAQLVFFDGPHSFEAILTDFVLADQILDIGGVMIINDMWLPAVRSIASYITNNMTNYSHIPVDHENVFVARKTKADERPWDHFAPFDGAGEKSAKKGFFSKIFG